MTIYLLTFLISVGSTQPMPTRSCDMISDWFRYSTANPPANVYETATATRVFTDYGMLDFVLRHERYIGAEVWEFDGVANKVRHYRVDQSLRLDSLTRDAVGYSAILQEIPLEQ